jgi:hypothetical protein
MKINSFVEQKSVALQTEMKERNVQGDAKLLLFDLLFTG